MRIAAAVGIGLGTMRLVETVKEVLIERDDPVVVGMTIKSTAATLIASGTAFWTERDRPLRERVLVAAMASGIATLAHETHVLLTTTSDATKQRVMKNGPVVGRAPRTSSAVR